MCLNWKGDDVAACTGWTVPDGDVGFIVSLGDNDMQSLATGHAVQAEPYRHFFGNATMGPNGDFPFGNGFQALAAHCGQDLETNPEIDLTTCGLSLHAWVDSSGDGFINPSELVELLDLGIESLGEVRRVGKKDACGNTFEVEAHATCSDRPGRCGTWYDVFFELREGH